MAETADTITLSHDGFSMPTVEVLTGRGFITGKSGSGKSNTTSVIAEELLEAGVPMLIVDTDGEYFGLKEQYEMLHVGGDEHCDRQVTPSHAENIAEMALEDQIPIILDISGYREQEEGQELVGNVVEELFVLEKTARTPFLLIVEEAHEFMPEQGALDDLGETLIRVAKRGRKRGLGICALSQRPAAVTKDYITQCDWLIWHRLTWENDTKVVGRILGNDYADEVQELDTGEAIVMTDWDDTIQNVKFREKRTFDAGATPDLDDIGNPNLQQIDGEVMGQLAGVDDVEDADDAAKYNRGEDPNYDEDGGTDTETHIAEVYGGQTGDDDESGGASSESSDGDGASEAESASKAESASEPADSSGGSDSSDGTASTSGTGSSPATSGPDPDDLKDRSDLAGQGESGSSASASGSDTKSPPASYSDSSIKGDLIPSGSSGSGRSNTPERSTRSTAVTGGSGTSGSSSKVTVESGRGRGSRTPRPRDPEPANDPAWEAAQFLTYVEACVVSVVGRNLAWLGAVGSRGVGAVGRGLGTLGAIGSRGLRRFAASVTRTPGGQRRVEAVLPKLLLLLLGILFGLVMAIILS